jgi:hypothetical protein
MKYTKEATVDEFLLFWGVTIVSALLSVTVCYFSIPYLIYFVDVYVEWISRTFEVI